MYLEIFLADFVVFRGILREYLNFSGPRPREISEALIFGGAYLWRGLLSEFYSISISHSLSCGEVAIDIQCTGIKGVYEIHCTSSTGVC